MDKEDQNIEILFIKFVIASHHKALTAWQEGRFNNEFILVKFEGKTIERDGDGQGIATIIEIN